MTDVTDAIIAGASTSRGPSDAADDRRRLRDAVGASRRGPRRTTGSRSVPVCHEYRHGVMDDGPGRRPARRCRPDWALQVPADYVESMVAAVRDAVADAGDRLRPTSWASAPTSPPARCCPVLADGTPLCELPELADRPHAYVKLWKHHAAQPHADRLNELGPRPRRAVDRPLRRPALVGVGAGQGAAAPRRGPRGLRADGPAGSRPPTGSSGSCAAPTSATRAPPGSRARCQDGAYPSAELLRGVEPGVRALRRSTSSSIRSARSAPGPAASRRPWPTRTGAARRASPCASATSTPTSPRRPPGRSAPGRWWRSWAPRPAT